MAAAERRILLSGGIRGPIDVVELDGDDRAVARQRLDGSELHAWVTEQERTGHVRWVLRSAATLHRRLLAEGVVLSRAHDLELCHAILRDTDRTAAPVWPSPRWVRGEVAEPNLLDSLTAHGEDPVQDALEQYGEQRRALASAPDGRLAMLCAAESAGALIAEELRAAGLPWDRARHDRILVETLGARSPSGGTPAIMAERAAEVRRLLGDERANLDSHPKLLRSLHRVGVQAASTSKWELERFDHPVIEPLLEYKRLARLLAANGWNWLDEWVVHGRFRPVYIVGGVVTGRWASSGGGALQVPRMLRPAVHADPGWTLVVADVAQLEPRMLAAMARDEAMATAARGADLYEGVVDSGAVTTREEAKYAVLGAMYGATTGDSGRLVPRLRKVYPRAMRLVDDAARTGERGGRVSTWLGRTSPAPDRAWQAAQSAASDVDAASADGRRAGQAARERGRFTRNFIVQGTAAEWSLIWLAEMRHRLSQLPAARHPAPASGPFAHRAHLAFFLHDEVIVHAPAEHAAQAAEAVREAAAVATTRLFGTFPIDVPLDLRITESAEK